MIPRILAAVAIVGSLWPKCTVAAQEKINRDEQAKAVAEKFITAFMTEKDLDKAVKLATVPYLCYQQGQEDKAMVLKTTDDVKKMAFVGVMVSGDEREPTAKHVTTYDEEFRKKLDGNEKFNKFRKALDEVLKPNDCMVTVRVPNGGFGMEFTTLVSWRDGQPKVVGCAVYYAR